VKIIDMINASFAAGEMPNSEGMVDANAARNMGLLLDRNAAAEVPGPSDDQPGPDGEEAVAMEPPAADSDERSEWVVAVVLVTGVVPIPGADSIGVAQFSFAEPVPGQSAENNGPVGVSFTADYPVVVRKESYHPGDKAVYVPVDSVLPDAPEFDFLGSDKRRLRAKRLRGVYSEGLLVPWNDFASYVARTVPDSFGDDAKEIADKTAEALDELLPVGADVAQFLGITRYRDYVGSGGRGLGRTNKVGPDESVFPYYSVSNARKGEGIQYLSGDTRVIVTEKLHGANIRFGTLVGAGADTGGESVPNVGTQRFYLGSHRTMRDPETDLDWFGRCARINALEQASARLPGVVFYGEILGVQDLKYGYDTAPSDYGLRVFDAYDANAERWCHWGDVVAHCKAAGLDHVPVLYDGPLNECSYQEMAEGQTCLDGASHVREGVVVRTYAGGGPSRRWKYVGQGYKLRKGQKDLVTE
jgi:RNA ligase (TIGR02306 family)